MNRVLIAVTAMLAIAACSKEKEPEKPPVKPDTPSTPEQPEDDKPLTFTATLQEFSEALAGTKTAMSGPMAIKWQPRSIHILRPPVTEPLPETARRLPGTTQSFLQEWLPAFPWERATASRIH